MGYGNPTNNSLEEYDNPTNHSLKESQKNASMHYNNSIQYNNPIVDCFPHPYPCYIAIDYFLWCTFGWSRLTK